MSTGPVSPPRFMRAVRVFALPIILLWLGVTIALNVLVPPIERVARENAISMSPADAPSVIAAKAIGKKFGESDSDSIVMIVLEGDTQLGDQAHRYYDGLVKSLGAETKHVQHVQNLWGDLITAAGSQSSDGKAAYVQIHIAGNQGSTLANQSVDAVRKIVDESHPPPGVKAYVTGPAALTTDMNEAADKSMFTMMGVTGLVIVIMLALVYRSVSTVLLVLAMVGVKWERPEALSPCSETIICSVSRRSSSRCCRRWRSPPGRTTRSSSSGATRRRAKRVKTGKPPTTPCFAVRITSSWVPV